MKLVILDGYTENPGDLSWDGLRELAEVTVYDRTSLTDPAQTIARIADAEIVLTNKTPLLRAVFEACPNIKMVGVLATGFNVVDIAAAKAAGIPVCNIPTYGTTAVAQFAMALLLELCHHVADHSRSVKAGDWSRCPDFCYWNTPLIELAGKTFGVIGYGRIGQATARLAAAFGMEVLACDAYAKPCPPARLTTLEEVLEKSDVISLHCPLTPETQGIINRETLDRMKDGVFLLNTSRGPLVDEAALASLMVGREVILTAQKVEKQVAAPVLEVKGLHVRDNDGNERVKGVDLAVRAGEIVGVAGVAGSGQKELVEALFGLREAQEGRVLFEGADITSKSCRERRCLGVGYVPQDRLGEGANVEGSIWQNAIMGYHIAHGFKRKLLLDRREIDAFSGQVVKQFAVKTPTLETRVRTLSGGNIQKLIVGREFLQKNKLLIVEDPTRGIDIGAIEFIWKKIIELASEGVGILLVSHELNEVMELSDRIVVMYDGKLFDGGNAGELTEQEIGLLMAGGGTADESGRKRGA